MRDYHDSSLREDNYTVNYSYIIDLYAKIHALDIHQSRNTPQEQLPRISPDTSQRAYELAYDLILTSLKYFEHEEANSDTDRELQHAAQLLEKLYLNKSLDTPNRTKELHTAALAYYLAGHYARAFVLMRGVDNSGNSSTHLMRLLFLRKLSDIKNDTLQMLRRESHIDTTLAKLSREGSIDDLEAIQNALEGTIGRIYFLLYEYARTGLEYLIERAIDLSQIGLQLSIEQQLNEMWIHFQCTIALLREYQRNSLWTCLRPMLKADQTHIVEKYIHAAFSRKPSPILELWRSQSHVIENIQDNKSYCLKMPTSSGKTRIAELAILKFLAETSTESEKKCLYIAPYRSLAAELEQSLRSSFEPLGVRVSQLYGSYDLNPAESLLADEAKILIATPEKMDAVLRYNIDDIAEQVGLLIIDEGHIIDANERGLRYEMFLHRSIQRYERKGVRTLFMSAVMPNVEQFAQWITGRSEDAILTSDWRASQLLIGILRWDGNSGRLDYLYRNFEAVDQRFFFQNYFSSFIPSELKEAGCNVRQFPKKTSTKSDLVAMAALEAIKEGPTLIFTPQKDKVKSIAESLIQVVQLQKQINIYFKREDAILPIYTHSPERESKLKRCIQYAEEATGVDSIIVRSLKCGFVVHCGDVPRALRLHLEDLIREGILQLVIANTTLAQGVNLPVKTILIHSIYNHQQPLTARDFWNLCGRAGRAMHETEGNVYFICDVTKSTDDYNKTLKQINKYVKYRNSEKIISAIRLLLERLVRFWRSTFQQIGTRDISNLCQILTSNDDQWLSTELQKPLKALDSQLLALIIEQDLDATDPERDLTTSITDLFKDSLLYIQLSSDQASYISETEAISLIVHRVKHIFISCKTRKRLQCYYAMALSIDGCATIESKKGEIANYLQISEDFINWTPQERVNYILNLCSNFLLQIKDISGYEDEEHIPDCWPLILGQWLLGKNSAEIATIRELPTDWQNAMKISTLIDNLCEFRLPWGLNAISMFWKASITTLEENTEIAFTPPEIINYFASMLRFGVHDPVAAVALALGLDNRQAALSLSSLYSGTLDAASILLWFQQVTPIDIKICTDNAIWQNLLENFVQAIKKRNQFDLPSSHSLHVKNWEVLEFFHGPVIEQGMDLQYEIKDQSIHLYTLDVEYLGILELDSKDVLERLKNNIVPIIVTDVRWEENIQLLNLQIG